MENAKNNQELFFERLKNCIGLNVNPVYEIADLLEISTDAVYRRMRGQTLLNFNEITTLCKHYNLGLEEFMSTDANEVRFTYIPLQNNFQNSYMDYIKSLRDHLKMIVKLKSPVRKIYFAATDIPIFHLCKFPVLKAFKIYTWQKQFGENNDQKFSFQEVLNSEMISIYEEISDFYDQIDSFEIWTHNTVDSYLKLVQYFYEIDCFNSKEDAITILDELAKLMDIIKGYGAAGFKINHGQKRIYNLFLSEFQLDNNLIYAETDDKCFSFIKLFSMNTISTINPLFCNGTKIWFDSVINKSILISGFSQKQFLLFFKEITKKIELTKDNIRLD